MQCPNITCARDTANVGERSKEYASAFSGSRVYCFEPVATTFADLERNVEGLSNCRCFQFGFGEEAGTVSMLSNLSHERGDQVGCNRIDAVVVVAVFREVARNLVTDDQSVIAPDRSHLGVLDG